MFSSGSPASAANSMIAVKVYGESVSESPVLRCRLEEMGCTIGWYCSEPRLAFNRTVVPP